MKTSTLHTTKSIVDEFAGACIDNNYTKLTNLLLDKGEFEIQTKNLVIRKANKKSFVKWFTNNLAVTKITSIDYDQCLHCYLGNSVLLFNRGEFPIIPKDSSYRSKMGLMLDVKEDKISRIKFCSLFLKTDNPFVFENRINSLKNREDPF